ETSKTVTVVINGDRLAEPDESFSVVLSNAVNGLIDAGQATGTIVNDEPLVSITDQSQAEGDAGTTVFTFTVTLSDMSTGPVTVHMPGGEAAPAGGSDYHPVSAPLPFPAGTTTLTIKVLVQGDQVLEYDEHFVINLSSGNQAPGTIQNDDGPVINIGDSSVYEGDYGTTIMEFTVWLSVPATDIVTVDFATFDGTATAYSDYTPTNGTLTFNPGEANKTIWVEVIGDLDYEGDEYFSVNLSNNSSNSLIQQAWGTGTIIDNDYYYWC